jgi:hypothetical protein
MRVCPGQGEFPVQLAGLHLGRLPIATTGIVDRPIMGLKVGHLLAAVEEKVALKFGMNINDGLEWGAILISILDINYLLDDSMGHISSLAL